MFYLKLFLSLNVIQLTSLLFLKSIAVLSGGFGRQQQRQAPPPISDSARSVDQGSVLEIISSGGKYGIRGFRNPDPLKDIYLDETPINSPDGQQNYRLTYIELLNGSLGQAQGRVSKRFTTETSVSVELTHNQWVVRTFSSLGGQVSHVGYRLSIVLLRNVKDNQGNTIQVDGNNVQYSLEYRIGTGAWVNVLSNSNLGGKFSSPYAIDRTIYLGNNWFNIQEPISIRIRRDTPPILPENGTIQLRWETYERISYQFIPLKRLAYLIYDFDTEQFGTNLPERRYRLDGMWLDKPSNATINSDGSHTYTGSWSGLIVPPSFVSDYPSGDVFSIIWYLLTDEIDGLGRYIQASRINKYDLYAISNYNNKIVNGERRFLYRIWMNTADEKWKKIDDILSTCHARRYWEGGILRFTQDRPTDIKMLVTNADIIGDFKYSSTDIYERANQVVVSWVNQDNFWKVSQEVVSVPVFTQKYGLVEKNVESIGCYSRKQAIRFARHIIYSENLESKVITFRARQLLKSVSIGDVILVGDSFVTGESFSGLITTPPLSSTVLLLDRTIQLKTLQGFDERFYLYRNGDVLNAVRNGDFKSGLDHYRITGQTEGRLPNGFLLFIYTSAGIEIRRILSNTISQITNEILLDSPLAGSVPMFTNWVIYSPENVPQTFRVISKELDEENLDTVTITANQYDEFKFPLIERNLKISTNPPKAFGVTAVPAPTNIRVSEDPTISTLDLRVSWDIPVANRGNKYSIGIRKSSGWIDTITFDNTFTFENLQPGLYQFRVAALSINDIRSSYVYSPYYTTYQVPDYFEGALVFGLYKCVEDYTGFCIRVYRTDDGATLDIGFGSDGWVDSQAILDFCGTSHGEVERIYEQKNGGGHLFSTGSLRGKIKTGTIITTAINNRPIIYSSGVGSFEYSFNSVTNRNTVISDLGEWTVNAVFIHAGLLPTELVAHKGGSELIRATISVWDNNLLYLDSGNPTDVVSPGGRRVFAPYSLPTDRLTQITTLSKQNQSIVRFNGNVLLDKYVNPLSIDSWSGTLKLVNYSGGFCEIIIFPTSKQEKWISIEKQQLDRYRIS